ncbi:hypothetical protein DL96DRAFT_889220 [Flagelloscypha sp. PMI_526]|nr:hypothetical protein DL96DRAFT_889220 [Flagelloscypha sp. PMI_526]
MSSDSPIVKNTEFFYDDLKVFRVENQLFRVPIRNLIDESEYFRDMFRDASPVHDPETGEEGASVDHPIIIGDETASAFVLLLKWVYKRKSSFSRDDWLNCLRMAHKFRVPKLTEVACKYLSNQTLDPFRSL